MSVDRRWPSRRAIHHLARVGFRAHHRLAPQLVALVVLVALFSGGSVGLLVVDRARNALRDTILQSSLATAELGASLAAGYIASAEGDARELAVSAEIRSAAARGDLGLATPELERWLREHPNLTGVGLADLAGVLRATGLEDKSGIDTQQYAERDSFQVALASGQPFLGAPGLAAISHRPRIPYGLPIRDDTGSVRAVMIASVSLESLSNMLTAVHLGPNARTSLLDLERRVILAHVDPSRLLTPLSGRNDATTLLLAGGRGAIENGNSSGQHTLSAFAPVAGLPWGVLIQEPSDDAFAPVDEMIRQAIGLVVTAVVLATAIGVGLALSTTRPIRQLRLAAEGMARGELDRRANIPPLNELGELGRAFDDMAEQLQGSVAMLRLAEGKSRRESERLLALHTASSALSVHAAEPTAVLDQILCSAVTLLQAGSGSLYRWDAEASLLRCVRNWRVPEADTTPDLNRFDGLAGHSFGTNEPIICNDYLASSFATQSGRVGGMRAGLAVPLLWNGWATGVLLVRVYAGQVTDPHAPPHFDEDDGRLAVLFGDQASTAMFTAEAFAQQRAAALHDSLTGLPNRVMLRDRLQQAISSEDADSTPSALLLLDLDRFKQVNDTFGHAYGDLLLREAGQRLAGELRTSDVAARVGGDEFSLVLTGTDAAGVRHLASNLARRFEEPFVLEGQQVRVGLSIGAAVFPGHGRSVDLLLRRADLAMYAAKRAGGGLVIYTAALEQRAA